MSLMTLPHVPRLLPIAAALACAAFFSGCSGEKEEKKKATQAAAKVNKVELTVHQINHVLGQQRAVPADQAEAAGKQVLEKLIEQELAVQKASDQKLDRDPRVITQLDAARKEIIARAYFEKVSAGAPKPTAEEVKKYYDENPALFANRRLFQFHEFNVQAKPEQHAALQGLLKAAKGPADFTQALQSAGMQFNANQVARAAEQLPMTSLPALSKMKDGEATFNPVAQGVQIHFLVASKQQPVDLVRATPAIEQFLLNDRKRKLIADDTKALRAAADVRYLGKFAEGAPVQAPVAPAPTQAQVAASAAKALDESAIKSGLGLKDAPAQTARPAAPIAEPVAPSASSVDASTINKGLGLK